MASRCVDLRFPIRIKTGGIAAIAPRFGYRGLGEQGVTSVVSAEENSARGPTVGEALTRGGAARFFGKSTGFIYEFDPL